MSEKNALLCLDIYDRVKRQYNVDDDDDGDDDGEAKRVINIYNIHLNYASH